MKTWFWRLLAACLLLIGGCGGPPEAMPADFELTYHWSEGSLPPPHHYEYTITLRPDGTGVIDFWPDYPNDNNPKWTKAFSITGEARAELYATLREAGIWSTTWKRADPPRVGGSNASLRAQAGGQTATIPTDLVDSQATGLEPTYAAIEKAVPQDIWDALKADRQRYQESHQ